MSFINQIEVDSVTYDIQDANAATKGSIALDYSELTFPVPIGTNCWQGNVLYKAKQTIETSEEWTASHWEAVYMANENNKIVLVQNNEPTDSANKLWIQPTSQEYQVPTYEEFEEVAQDVNILTQIASESFNVDFSTTTVINGYINTSNKWTYSSSGNQKSYGFSINESIRKISITANDDTDATIGILKNSNNLSNQQTPNYCDGISGRIIILAGTTQEINIPTDCTYITMNKENSTTSYAPESAIFYSYRIIPNVDKTLTVEGDAADSKATGEIKKIIYGKTVDETINLTSGGRYVYASNNLGEEPALSSGQGKYAIFDISHAISGGAITITIDELTTNDQVVMLIVDENNYIVSKYVTSNKMELNPVTNKYEATILIPNGVKMCFSIYGGSDSIKVTLSPVCLSSAKIKYVSPNGSDTNSGISLDEPMATINAALRAGARTILVDGGVYYQKVDLSGITGVVKIAPATSDKLPIFYSPDSLITDFETMVDGTTKVYFAPCTKTFDNKIIWLFQDNVPDVTTEISDEDRHPLSRGKQYRCGDTVIKICSSGTTQDAIAEIEAASDYKWFYDTSNNIIYFSRPQPVTTSNPIMTSFGGSFINNKERGLTLEIIGIDIKYMGFNLTETTEATLVNCSSANVRGSSAFRWDSSVAVKLYKCEASRVFYTANAGDGFNAHSNNTNDAFAHQTCSMLFDCWAHDCCDDGYSDHERCEISIYGGLFENNGGGGVTPAVGSHCTCYNVLSRYNKEADFFYTGNPASSEGGVGGQIACYNCVAIGSGQGTNRGFRLNGSDVRGMFVNCVAINQGTGFYGESNAVGTLYNCSTINCTTAKTSHYTAYNGTPVT